MRFSMASLCLLLTVLLNTGASLLLKLTTTLDNAPRTLVGLGSISCYGLSFIAYFFCLRNFPVSVAYPVITGGTILAVVMLASPFLGEHLTLLKSLGGGLIIIGGALLIQQP